MRWSSHFVRTRAGDYKLRLDPDERELLDTLPDQMEALITSPGSEASARLFPPAYHAAADEERNEEYQRLMRSELVQRRIEAVSIIRSTLDAPRLTREELDAWMRVLNDVRLVLGTILDVSEDDDPEAIDPSAPDAPQRLAYVMLSALVADAVDVLSGSLPPPTQV